MRKDNLSICKRTKYIILERSLVEYNFGAQGAAEMNKFMSEIGYDEVEVVCSHYKELWDQVVQEDVIFKNREVM